MTDAEIVALYWNRSEEAIAHTMRTYGRYLMKLAVNILRLRQEAEECVNDTYLSAWNQMSPDRPEKLMPYLGRIARCLALNRYDYLTARKRSAEFTLQLSELEDCLPASGSVERQYESAELAAAISAFLRGLEEEPRNLFIRRYWYSDSIRQLAARYGTGENKVKSQLFRVRGKLREYLKKEGFALRTQGSSIKPSGRSTTT